MAATRQALISIVLGTSAAIAIAGLPPGYTWGLAHCGPAVNNSRVSCMACCNEAVIDGDISPGMVTGCHQMCSESVFNAPTPNWFWRLFVRVFA